MERVIKPVPTLKDVSADNFGVIYYKGKAINGNIYKYRSVTVPGHGTMLAHRLICEAFHGLPTEEKPIVNHKDGDPTNNKADNLEWVSYSGNINHAYESGLRTDNTIIFVKSIITGEEKEFISMQKAAKHLGVNGGKVHAWLNSPDTYLFEGEYDIRYANGKYKGLTKADITKRYQRKAIPIIAVYKDGSIKLYDSCSLAAFHNGIHPTVVQRSIDRKEPRYVNDKYMFRKLDEYVGEIPKDTKMITRTRKRHPLPTRKPVPVIVTDLINGGEKEYESSEAFANIVSVKKSAVQKATKLNSWRGYNIRYKVLD